MAHEALARMVQSFRCTRGRLTVDSSNIDLPVRAVRISLQPTMACKSTSCRPFATSGPRARNNLYCPKHASRRFTPANAPDRWGPIFPHARAKSRDHENTLDAGPRGEKKCEFNSSIWHFNCHIQREFSSHRNNTRWGLFKISPICRIIRWSAR